MQQDDRIFAVVGACIVVAVALVAAIIWLGQKPLSTPEASLTPASQIVESGLADEGDDGLIRSAVARLSSHPEFTSYLVNDRLLRRFVLSVDAIAGGYSPSNELEFLRPLKPFYVSEDEGRLVVASGTYRRYNVVSDVFTSIDANGAVEIYREFRPRLEAIYREVGWANDDFDTRLREAVDHLLEVNAPTGQIEVEQRAIVYAYAEDRFENLTEAQKHLLRMGSRNAAAIQAKLSVLRSLMGWPEPVPAIVTAELELSSDPKTVGAPVIADAAPLVASDSPVEATGAAEAP
jgi:hypothetical protein